ICGISSRERPSLRAVRVVEGGVCGTAGGVRAAYHSPGCLRYRHLGGDPRPTGDHVREPETHYTRGKDGWRAASARARPAGGWRCASAATQDFQQDVILGREVQVEGAPGHPRRVDDGLDLRGRDAAAAKLRYRRLEQAVAGREPPARTVRDRKGV